MLPISVNRTIHFEPDGADGPLYKLKVPSVMEKSRFQEGLLEERASYPPDKMIRDSIRSGVKALVPEDQQPVLLEVIDHIESIKEGDEVDKELLKQYTEILTTVSDNWPELAKMLAKRVVFFDVYCIVAVRHFLIDIERGTEYKRDGLELSEYTLSKIPSDHLGKIGAKISELMNINGKTEKNLKSQSQSQSNQETSIAEEKPQTDQSGNSSENLSELILP